MQEVIGSTPIYSTKATVIRQLLFFEGGSSSSGRAFGSQSKGSGFESHLLHKKNEREPSLSFFDARQASRVFRTGITINGPGIAINIILV